MTMGENIRQARMQARLSQEKLAELVGVSRQAVTKWEKGQSEPSCENLLRLAEVLGVQVSDLAPPQSLPKGPAHRRAAARLFLLWIGLWLLGRLIFGLKHDFSVMGWVFSWYSSVYLFGWLLSSNLYWYTMVAACAAAALNRVPFALSLTGGFFVGWLAGELLGPRQFHAPSGTTTHYGWVTWAVTVAISLVIGIVLEKRKKE